jgi:hypothetical protein
MRRCNSESSPRQPAEGSQFGVSLQERAPGFHVGLSRRSRIWQPDHKRRKASHHGARHRGALFGTPGETPSHPGKRDGGEN